MKNWDFHPYSIEQCKNQSSQNEMYDKAFKEGCQLYGTLLVNRVSNKNFKNANFIIKCKQNHLINTKLRRNNIF